MKPSPALAAVIFLILPGVAHSQNALQLESFRGAASPGDASCAAFAVGLEAGLLFGAINEWVLIDREADGAWNDTLSKLDWGMNPLRFIGASGSFAPTPAFHIGFGVWLGIPGPIGSMEDRDWDETTGEFSIYSRSDNRLENAVFTDFNLGLSIVREPSHMLNLMLGFTFRQYHFSGHDTLSQIPPGAPSFLSPGKTIDFEYNHTAVYLAAEIAWAASDLLTVDCFLSASPLLSFAYDRDDHILTGYYFQDVILFGLDVSAVCVGVIHLGADVDLLVTSFLSFMPLFKGRTYVNGGLSSAERSGSSFFLGGLTLGVRYSFGRAGVIPVPAAP